MKVNFEIALDSDPTGTQIVHRNDLVECFPRDNQLSHLLSTYRMPFNDNKTENFHKKCARNQLSQLNQPIELIAERQHLKDFLPIFLDKTGLSRMDTKIISPVE